MLWKRGWKAVFFAPQIPSSSHLTFSKSAIQETRYTMFFFLIPTLQMNIGYIGVKLFALNLTRIRLKVALYILMPQECRCHELGQNSEANVIKLYIKLL